MPFNKICPACRQPFVATQSRITYCSRKCYGVHVAVRLKKTIQQLLFDRIQKTDGCWIWTGFVNKSGYGRTYTGGYGPKRLMLAHRFAYHVLVGPIPDGIELDHLCKTLLCVNPAHLEPVTQTENARRARVVHTHCKHGHPFSPENTRVYKGAKYCRECHRQSGYKRRDKRRARARLLQQERQSRV